MTTTVTGATREVLAAAWTEGNMLYLPGGQLAPKLYGQVDRVIREAGGKWKGGRVKAHVFTPGADAAQILAGLLTADRVTSGKQQAQWYPSPPEVVTRLIEAARLRPGLEVLEPSAGEGVIAVAVAAGGCVVDCVELDPARAEVIEAGGYARKVTCGDFLSHPPVPGYDAVVMNPPFAGRADERHVLHALRLLRRGGTLVSVMGAGVRYRSNQAAKRICAMADGAVHDLPAGAFRTVGADFPTVIVVIRTGADKLF